MPPTDVACDETRPHLLQFRLPALVYFFGVALVTGFGLGVLMLFSPTVPHSIRARLGLESPLQAKADSFFAVRVAPVIEEHCVGCHGARRQKGKLRLDTFGTLMRGGRHGAVVKPSSVKDSELASRITLLSSNERVMPPTGRPPLSADEVTVIKLWIAAGASGVQPVSAIKGAPNPVKKVDLPKIDRAAVERKRAGLSAVVRALETRFPQIIAYESRGSADLHVNASLRGAAYGDADLTALAPLSNNIVWMDLSGTSITDASVTSLTSMKRLRVLRVANTRATNALVRALAHSNALQSLTVVGTAVTEESLRPIRARGIKVNDGHGVQ